MAKIKKRHKCKDCAKKFLYSVVLWNHRRKIHPLPFKEHITFASLISGYDNWGQSFDNKKDAKEFRDNPSDSALQFGIWLNILEVLREIKVELQREKIIK